MPFHDYPRQSVKQVYCFSSHSACWETASSTTLRTILVSERFVSAGSSAYQILGVSKTSHQTPRDPDRNIFQNTYLCVLRCGIIWSGVPVLALLCEEIIFDVAPSGYLFAPTRLRGYPALGPYGPEENSVWKITSSPVAFLNRR